MHIPHFRARLSPLWLLLALSAALLLAAACTPVAPATPQPAAATQSPAPTAAPTQAPSAAATGATVPTATVAAVDMSKVQTGVDADGNFYRGDPKAAVKLVEYSDFQCPYCGRHTIETAPQLDATYVATGKVLHIFRNFPLDIHPNALPAAKAAYCAGQQKPAYFWGMHDWLFAQQDKWASAQDAAPQFKTEAVSLGVDAAKYDTCVAASDTETKIKADMDRGIKEGVQGTPAFFINDWFLNGAVPFSEFQQAIDKAQAGQHPAPTPTALPDGVNFYDINPAQPGLTYDNSPTIGDAKAPLLMIAFQDFKCAECKQFATEVLPALRDKYVKDGKLRIMYAYSPTEAPKAAIAGVCAARQNKFWEFHDLLFAHQAEWKDGDNAAMAGYAKTAGLDVDKFNQCLGDASAQTQLEHAADFGQQLGVPKTPAFLIADIQQNQAVGALVGAQPLSEFESKIQEGLNPPTPEPTAAAAGTAEAPAATATPAQ